MLTGTPPSAAGVCICAACTHPERGHRTTAKAGNQWPPAVLFCPRCPGEECHLAPGQVAVLTASAAEARTDEVSRILAAPVPDPGPDGPAPEEETADQARRDLAAAEREQS